ncbi:MAG: M48 family metalloprotease [Sphingomonadaceae bacterium]
MSIMTRRTLLAGATCLCCAGWTGIAAARKRPEELEPLIGPGYAPQDKDERGIWEQYERIEADIAGSNLLIEDPALTSYLAGLAARVGGPAAQDLRVYLAHVPEFNAFMAPTGFMVVFSGLLTRMKNEAQLAGVLAHEAGHFLLKHQIRAWRDLRGKTDALSILGLGAGVGGVAAGVYLGDIVRLAQFGTIFSLASYGRGLEAEADALGVRLISDARYSPLAMPDIWRQLIGEIEASARMRRVRPDRGYSLLATHPAPEERMEDLGQSAREIAARTRVPYETGRERYLQAIDNYRPMLLEDQVKLNDPGASLFIIQTLAEDGWNGLLRYHEAEVWRLRGRDGDAERAAAGYARAITYADAPPEAWRAHGYALLKTGRAGEGRKALATYLEMKPDAPDAPMVRYTLRQ